MNKNKSKTNLTHAELEAAASEFDGLDYAPRFAEVSLSERRRHDQAIRRAKRKRGRPIVGKGAERIQITVERSLLHAADCFARGQHISRSELIARGLRLALAS